MAQHLRAVMLRQPEDERYRLHAEVKAAGSKGAYEVMRAAFEVAVRRYFRQDVDLHVIGGFVDEMREAFGESVPVMESETLIRAALGEGVPAEDIDPPTKMATMTFTLLGLTDKWYREVSVVNSVLVEAEELVRLRGFDPTSAP